MRWKSQNNRDAPEFIRVWHGWGFKEVLRMDEKIRIREVMKKNELQSNESDRW
jgi:hypothetical protein